MQCKHTIKFVNTVVRRRINSLKLKLSQNDSAANKTEENGSCKRRRGVVCNGHLILSLVLRLSVECPYKVAWVVSKKLQSSLWWSIRIPKCEKAWNFTTLTNMHDGIEQGNTRSRERSYDFSDWPVEKQGSLRLADEAYPRILIHTSMK